jgi:hypothetical protein
MRSTGRSFWLREKLWLLLLLRRTVQPSQEARACRAEEIGKSDPDFVSIFRGSDQGLVH